MEKQLMISMKVKYALAILHGVKTLELRNWIPKNFIGWVNVHMTEAKPQLNNNVVFRFWFENYGEIKTLNKKELLKKACISEIILKKYESGFAWHIDKLEEFKIPKTLEDFNLKKAPQKCAYVYVDKEERK